MTFIYLLLATGTGVGFFAVTALMLAGHIWESVSVLVLVLAAGYFGGAFAKRTPVSTGLSFAGFCLALSLQAASHMAFGLSPDGLWAWLNFGSLLAAGPLYLDFVTRFPLRRPELRWLVVLAYGLCGLVATTGALGFLGPHFDPMHPLAQQGRISHFLGHSPMYSPGSGLVMMAVKFIALWVMWSSRQIALQEKEHRAARQALVLMLGTVVGWLPLFVFSLGVIPRELEFWFHAQSLLFVALIPFAGAAALRHPDFYDDRGLLRRWLIGIGLVTAAYLLYMALVRLLSLLLHQVSPGAGREPAVVGATIVVALVIRPMKGWMSEHVDLLLFPHLLGFRTLLQETSQALATTIIPADVAKVVTESLPARLGATGAVLLVLDNLEANLTSLSGPQIVISQDHPVWHEACRANGPTVLREAPLCTALGLTAPALMLPLRVGGRLVGIYVLGSRQPGVDYTRQELEQLRVLGHHMAVSVENVRALRKIDDLSQRALAEVEERNRIAREIHDTIAQGLTAASLQLDVAEATLTTDPGRAAKAMVRAQSIVRANLAEARRSVLELRAPLLGTESFPAALSQLMTQAAEDMGASGSFQVEGTYRGLPARVENQLYRIAQEALHNAVKYSSASHLIVHLHIQEYRVSLNISDDGAGFDPGRTAEGSHRGGFGLTGMAERVRLVGGQLYVRSEPGQGTMVSVTVPLGNHEGDS